MRKRLPVCLFLLFLGCGCRAHAGEMLSLSEKTFAASEIVEFQLPLDSEMPARWPSKDQDPKGSAFPDALLTRAKQGARATRILKPAGAELDELPEGLKPFAFSKASLCWWKGQERGTLRTLAFLSGEREIVGVENEGGLYTDLNPDYPRLVEALERAGAWTEERMRDVPAGQLWQDQRSALASDNPYLMRLAADFLAGHEGGAVVDEAWGAPGSPEREAKEKAARLPVESVCTPPQ